MATSQLQIQDRERELRNRHVKMKERLTEHTKNLKSLAIGETVYAQNQLGNFPRKWDKTGAIVECKPYDQYLVRLDGSRRVTLRNRKFLRAYTPWQNLGNQTPARAPESPQIIANDQHEKIVNETDDITQINHEVPPSVDNTPMETNPNTPYIRQDIDTSIRELPYIVGWNPEVQDFINRTEATNLTKPNKEPAWIRRVRPHNRRELWNKTLPLEKAKGIICVQNHEVHAMNWGEVYKHTHLNPSPWQ